MYARKLSSMLCLCVAVGGGVLLFWLLVCCTHMLMAKKAVHCSREN
jgi:hypothetical protein